MAGELAKPRGKPLANGGGPKGTGPEIGTRYLKSAMKRHVRNHPDQVDKIAARVFKDAESEEAAIDRHRAATFIRDTLDGKPTQSIDVQGAPPTNVIIAHATVGEDPDWPDEIKELLKEEMAESGEIDLDDPHPEESDDE